MKIDVIKKAEEYLESLPQKKFAGEWIRKNDVRQMLIQFFEKEEDNIEILEAHLKNQELEVQRLLSESKKYKNITVPITEEDILHFEQVLKGHVLDWTFDKVHVQFVAQGDEEE